MKTKEEAILELVKEIKVNNKDYFKDKHKLDMFLKETKIYLNKTKSGKYGYCFENDKLWGIPKVIMT